MKAIFSKKKPAFPKVQDSLCHLPFLAEGRANQRRHVLQKYKAKCIRFSLTIAKDNFLILLLLATYFYAAHLFKIVNPLLLNKALPYTQTWGIFTLLTLTFIFLAKLLYNLNQGFKVLTLTWGEIRQDYLPIDRLTGFLLFTGAFPFFINTFHGFKRAIPTLHPYAWDEFFMKLDFAIHFNHHPWALLQPVLGKPLVTRIIDFFYGDVWVSMLVITIFWMAWHPNRALRIRFYLSFFLAWIVLGTLAATLFSSAGPCFFSHITGQQTPYAPLLEYLHMVDEKFPLKAISGQKYLWAAYSGNSPAFASGISAMPSIHVAQAMLLTLLGWSMHRWLGIFLSFYTLLILLGSIHLAWHYAIDGYFSIISTLVIWHTVGRVLNLQPTSPTINN